MLLYQAVAEDYNEPEDGEKQNCFICDLHLANISLQYSGHLRLFEASLGGQN